MLLDISFNREELPFLVNFKRHFLCFYSDTPVTAAEERAGRGLDPAELSRAGRVSALGDERVQVSDMDRLLSLMLNGKDRISHYHTQAVWIILHSVLSVTFLS